MDTQGEDEFEKYRSRAYSAGSRISSRPTRSLPGTPRVKKYTILQSLCGIQDALDEPAEFGMLERTSSGRQGNYGSRSSRGTPERDREQGDGSEFPSPPEKVAFHTVLQQPPGVLRHEVEPFRRAYSMKHHRPLSRINNSTTSSNTISSSGSSGSSGSTGVTAVSPPARTDSPTPNSWRGRSPNRPKDLDLGRGIRPRTSSMPSRSQYHRPDGSRCRSAYGTNTPENQEFTENPSPFRRVRSFKSTPKGIINRGDSLKARKGISTSQASLDSVGNRASTAEVRPRTYSNASSKASSGVSRDSSLEQDLEQAQYQVIMVGSQGVGKTALSQQFTTSEYMGNVDTSIGE